MRPSLVGPLAVLSAAGCPISRGETSIDRREFVDGAIFDYLRMHRPVDGRATVASGVSGLLMSGLHDIHLCGDCRRYSLSPADDAAHDYFFRLCGSRSKTSI